MQSYWFNDAELNLLDPYRDQKRQTLFAKLKTEPKTCVAASFEAFDERISRTHGYKFAIEKWMTLYSLEYHPKAWPRGTDIRKRIEELTRIPFQSKEGLKNWWEENHKYLLWYPEVKSLLVNTKAQKNKKPVLHSEKEIIKPAYYWSLKLHDDFFDEWRTDEWVYGHAYVRGETEFVLEVKIPVSALQNREIKKQAFHDVLHGYSDNEFYARMPVHFKTKTALKIMQLTGKKFKTHKAFKNWWETNKKHLILSEDGHRLIVRK